MNADRHSLEPSLQQERDFMAAVLNTVDALVVVLDPHGRIVSFNQACQQTTGYSFNEVKGRCFWDFLLVPEEISLVKRVFEELTAGHFPNQQVNYWVTKDGKHHLISWSNTALVDDHHSVSYIIATGIDITDYNASEQRRQLQSQNERLLAQIALRIRQSLNLKDILATTVAEVRQLLQVDRVLIFRFQPNLRGVVLVESIGPGDWTPMQGVQIYDPCFANTFADRYRQGYIAAIDDIYAANLASCFLDVLGQFQARATLVVPIVQGRGGKQEERGDRGQRSSGAARQRGSGDGEMERWGDGETVDEPQSSTLQPLSQPVPSSSAPDNQLWGLLVAHHCSAPRTWRQLEINLLSQLATQLAIAIQQSELYQQLQAELAEREQVEVVLQEAKQELEQRVDERTAELRALNQQLRLELNERKQAEAALQVSQDRFAGILEIADAAIITIDASQAITLFNRGAEEIFGYRTAEILGQPLDVLLPGRFVHVHRQHVIDFGQSNSRTRSMGERRQVYGRRKDGTEFPAEASISKLELGQETIFTVILRDITNRRQAQAELERLSHQNELILNSMGEGLCGLDLQARITFVNSAAANILGYATDELIDQPIELILPATAAEDPSQDPQTSPIFESLMDGAVHHVAQASFRRRDDTRFPVEYVSTPIYEQGQILGAVITFKDISDRLVIEHMKDEFISVVSHELRTPLTSIHGSLRMLASGLLKAQPEKSQRLLNIASDSTDRLVRLINDILDVERIESGKVKMVKQVYPVANLMTQAANTMRPLAEKAGVTLSVTPVSVQIWVDGDRIIQTFTNLLSNAIKFSHPGGTVWLTAEIVAREPRGIGDGEQRSGGGRTNSTQLSQPARSAYSDLRSHSVSAGETPNSIPISSSTQSEVRFSVHDQGRGIPPDKIETIFERFQQADASDARNHEGTGLGLAICRSIVQQHNGHIWVESKLGEGSTFYVTLPMLHCEASRSESS